ncbi:hypothetical protein CMV_027880 [Castanea mollissima]|uniref:TIR domain-containing protein n=1 Tax=Castanea mollissima TaxID=60419 RepID=A0A8J4V2C9_9ROSI|nr:hypothetical protein CMV_027880 [Castanea mollissima]
MASMGTERASSSSSFTPCWTYDVFLSFRDEDTRNGFTDHLYFALKQKGIFTFRDDEKLERGKSISPKLLKAIEESRFAIVILSRNYAYSIWCLDELAEIIKCMKEIGITILPIFNKVDHQMYESRQELLQKLLLNTKRRTKRRCKNGELL